MVVCKAWVTRRFVRPCKCTIVGKLKAELKKLSGEENKKCGRGRLMCRLSISSFRILTLCPCSDVK